MQDSQRAIVIIFGPSGVGKTSVIEAALANESCARVRRVVTTTSRKPRSGEVTGDHYNFISQEEFLDLIEKRAFIEWSSEYGAYYGLLRKTVEDVWEQGNIPVVLLDRNGVASIKNEYPRAVVIFLAPPSLVVLEQRLRKRQTEDEREILRRLILAEKEITEESNDPLADYYVVNDVFESTIQKIASLVCVCS